MSRSDYRPSILLVNWRDTRHPEGGGSERYVERIAEGLAQLGYRVAIQCAGHGRAPSGDWVAGVHFRRRGNKFTVYLHALLAILRSDADVIVDVQNGMPFFSRLVARCPVLVLVHHVHREQWHSALGPFLGRIGWWVESWLAPRLYRKCRYITVSNVTRDELAHLGVELRRTAVVPNGLDAPPAVTTRRTESPVLVAVSRLVPHKRLEHAIDLVAQLRPQWPDLRLELVGEGPWKEVLHQHAIDRGVQDNVVIHGWVDEQTKHEILAGAWVHLCPSVKEGWGIVIMEAASHGVPTVAYRSAGGVAEAIVDHETGLLAEDFADFVRHTDTLLRDRPLRKAMGAAGRQRAQQFSWEESLGAFENVLNGALRATAGPRGR
ncbi:Glycosyltransferase involved in cell wall bisynthesis [Lentzea fradiae]|uniref:Glycosyltransferase involved in cell wall bisynthesis n=1 Tax=Lentzea fradiae TaxID=200378 RepID=A0A1G7KS91_9PSEU|nr:glycosyltransferase family 4 protein [Lentzea fradiae]SDF40082.1 Glycosyltransferase involved in cell wall bisynthesis [Lentzea fradiae]